MYLPGEIGANFLLWISLFRTLTSQLQVGYNPVGWYGRGVVDGGVWLGVGSLLVVREAPIWGHRFMTTVRLFFVEVFSIFSQRTRNKICRHYSGRMLWLEFHTFLIIIQHQLRRIDRTRSISLKWTRSHQKSSLLRNKLKDILHWLFKIHSFLFSNCITQNTSSHCPISLISLCINKGDNEEDKIKSAIWFRISFSSSPCYLSRGS